MSISHVGGGAQSPAATIAELVRALADQRRTELETEQTLAEQAVAASEDRARHALERSEALRGQAWLRFGLALAEVGAQVAAATAGAVALRSTARAQGPAERVETAASPAGGREVAPLASRVEEQVSAWGGALSAAAQASEPLDEAVGFGASASRSEAEMARDEAAADLARARLDQVQASRHETEDALADARQCYRDVASPKGGA
jgi:hypothetical protein